MTARLQPKPRGTSRRYPLVRRGDQVLVPFSPMGLNFDHPAPELGPEVWTQGQGVVFRNDAAERQGGDERLMQAATLYPQHGLHVPVGANQWWMVGARGGAFAWNGVQEADIGPSPGFSVAEPWEWTSGLLNGVPVMNLARHAPMTWDGVPANRMTTIPGWPEQTKCIAMRPYRYHLVAMGVEDNQASQLDRVLWSAGADPGSLPGSWTPAADNDAGDNTLGDTPGALVDGVALRDVMLLCKQHSIYTMTYVGGTFTFLFRKVLETNGMLTTNCGAEVLGRALILTDGDVILFDGVEAVSMVQDRMKRWLFRNIDTNWYLNCFVVSNPANSEVWVCFPETGTTDPEGRCNLALVWDRTTDSWGVRTIAGAVGHIARGIIPDLLNDPSWDGDDEAWDLDTTRWKERTFNPVQDGLLSCGGNRRSLNWVDQGVTNEFDGAFESYLAKHSMMLDDLGSVKLITALWPRFTAPTVHTFSVRIGVQMEFGDAIQWGPEMTWRTDQEKIDVLLTGRYLSVEFRSSTPGTWRMDGFSVQVADAGRW